MERTRLHTDPDGLRESVQLSVAVLCCSFRSWSQAGHGGRPRHETRAFGYDRAQPIDMDDVIDLWVGWYRIEHSSSLSSSCQSSLSR
jgi:hypothetical protein